ncbi:MAG: hypothetical protein J7500_15580 [Sphingomonas sp.]|uniref:hypothetical protein n=1 Tax=Sphingomonas sp. TaxID=28214 RepID=UPI001B198618|nr:hypothetical protein [Sphingomonas sp.]MBO9624128.1 hypothetical protein [Sphingomonas sp.]
MTGILHNAPPVERWALHIEDLFELISGTVAGAEVTTDEQDAALDSLLDDVRKARKDADVARVAEKKPHDDAAKAVQAAWKPLLDRCDMAADEIKRLLTPYRTAKQKAKDEAARVAREEAEAKQRAAQEALRQSGDLEAKFAAEADLKQAQKLTASANRIDREATGLRTYWDVTLTDAKAALLHYMQCQPDALKAWLQDQAERDVRGGARAIPGFTITEQKRAA